MSLVFFVLGLIALVAGASRPEVAASTLATIVLVASRLLPNAAPR